jgi:ligand-binding sensor domain-containing protein
LKTKFSTYILKSLTLSGFLLLTSFLSAQQYNFINYTSDQGLAQSQVTSIVQDKKGYLWFSTFGGVSRFDGRNFKNYSKDNGLINNQLFSQMIDSKNRIWFTGPGGFSYYEKGKIRTIRLSRELSRLNVVGICEDAVGDYWIAIERAGVAHYMRPDRRPTRWRAVRSCRCDHCVQSALASDTALPACPRRERAGACL